MVESGLFYDVVFSKGGGGMNTSHFSVLDICINL